MNEHPVATPESVTLRNENLIVVVDPGLGADVLQLLHRRRGVDVLFRTPWRDRALAIRAGQRPAAEPGAAWLEHYRGGWQTLCPVAGDARVVHGAPVGFHGEAARIPWTVHEVGPARLVLSVELFTVPVRIERRIRLDGPSVVVDDAVHNLSPVPLRIDYVHHPAFGGAFVDGPLRLGTNARVFTPDPERPSVLRPGPSRWPEAVALTGSPVRLDEVPPPGSSRELFGWLADFEPDDRGGAWVRILNPGLRLAVDVAWTGLPYAWLWQELEYTEQFPWFRRARAIAVEPSSVQTSGPGRSSEFALEGHGTRSLGIAVTLEDGVDA